MITKYLPASLILLSLSMPAWSAEQHEGHFYSKVKNHHGDNESAQRGQKGPMHEALQKMSTEERKAFKKEVKEKWDALSEEEKAAFKVKADEMMEARKKAQEERRLIRLYGLYLLNEGKLGD